MKQLKFLSLALALVCGAHSIAYGEPAGSRTTAIEHTGVTVRYKTPIPPYPYLAARNHIHGKGVIQVSFDGHGDAIKATMLKSTGSGLLDENAVQFARRNWKSLYGKPSTITVPLVYDL